MICHVTIGYYQDEDSSKPIQSAHAMIPKDRQKDTMPLASKDRQKPLASILVGPRTAGPNYLKDPEKNSKAFFFSFPDLSIRVQGEFLIECTCIDISTYTRLYSGQ